MSENHFRARYRVETPLDLSKVADIMAGEQSCGTFIRVAGETDELNERAGASVVDVRDLGETEPSLPSAWLERNGHSGPSHAGEITVQFPIANVGKNLPSLASVVAGNLFDLGESTGLRLQSIELPTAYRNRYPLPAHGIAGTRKISGVSDGAMLGTIIKPNVGLSSAETAQLVELLCQAGVDFIKDDEICANPVHAPLAERVPAVMKVVRDHEEKTGKRVIIAFNITDETDAMRRHADLVRKEGGSCIMASLNWCGYSAIETLRRSTDLILHGHRNGFGAMSRHHALGIGFDAYQTLWRLAGVDHMHVHGIKGKFAQSDAEVIADTKSCLRPLSNEDDRVVPVFSSGQWAGTVPATFAAIETTDLLFLAGGGVMAHPDGPAAGVTSMRDAWDATSSGTTLDIARRSSKPLDRALEFFGP